MIVFDSCCESAFQIEDLELTPEQRAALQLFVQLLIQGTENE